MRDEPLIQLCYFITRRIFSLFSPFRRCDQVKLNFVPDWLHLWSKRQIVSTVPPRLSHSFHSSGMCQNQRWFRRSRTKEQISSREAVHGIMSWHAWTNHWFCWPHSAFLSNWSIQTSLWPCTHLCCRLNHLSMYSNVYSLNYLRCSLSADTIESRKVNFHDCQSR